MIHFGSFELPSDLQRQVNTWEVWRDLERMIEPDRGLAANHLSLRASVLSVC